MGSAALAPASRLQRLQRLLQRVAPNSQLHGLVFGVHKIEASPILLRQRRVYILPSLHGVTFALSIALMLIGSINYALSLGFILTFLLAGLVLVALVHTYRNVWHLLVSPGRCEPVFAGTHATVVLHFENRSRYDRFNLVAMWRGAKDARSDVDVRAGEIATISLAVPAERRGWLTIDRLTVESRYPLGIFRCWSYVHPALRVLVYPRPEVSELPAESVRPEDGAAVEIGAGNDDFAGLRPYQPSDSLRHVAWKVAARTDMLFVKQWSGRGTAELWLDWAQAGDEPEARLSRLAGWVLQAEHDGRLYGLRLPGAEIAPHRGPAHRDACLKVLALYGIEDTEENRGEDRGA